MRSLDAATAAVVPPMGREAAQLEALLDDARKRLIDSGTRNRLVHTNRTGKRPFTLAVLYPETDDLFSRLVGTGASMRFLADPLATGREQRREATESAIDVVSEDDSEGIPLPGHQPTGAPGILQTRLGQSGLEKRLTKMLQEAKTLEEEQGINVLYLAIGFLRWYEDDNSQVLREAPLVLVPVQITRDLRRSRFELTARADDRGLNIALAERLREFGIALPEISDADDDWAPSIYFQQVRDAVSNKSRWSVDANGVELGFFSFAKLLMFTQLTGQTWPMQSILSHPLLRGLLQEGFTSEPPLYRDDDNIDALFKPLDLMHVLDADGSQTLAIETVRAGKNLVIQGPPGTGKSQTIANIIAAAVHDRKTVLFVAEKMVALEVVHKRLSAVGLNIACLELHSRNANKRAVLQELKRTLESGIPVSKHDSQAGQLTQARDVLNTHVARMHVPIGACGVTPFQALGVLVRSRGAGFGSSCVSVPSTTEWTPAQIAQARITVTHLADRVDMFGPLNMHPWRGIERVDLQPMDLDRVDRAMANLLTEIEAIPERSNPFFEIIFPDETIDITILQQFIDTLADIENAPDSLSKFKEYLDPLTSQELHFLVDASEIGLRAQSETLHGADRYRSNALQGDHERVRSALLRGTVSFFARWGTRYRAASAELATWIAIPLPKQPLVRLALVDDLVARKELYQALDKRSIEGTHLLDRLWLGEETDFVGLIQSSNWFLKLRNKGHIQLISAAIDAINAGGQMPDLRARLIALVGIVTNIAQEIVTDLQVNSATAFSGADFRNVPLTAIAAKLTTWRQKLDVYSDWCALVQADHDVRDLGLVALADAAATGTLSASRLLAEFDLARAEAVWRSAVAADRELGTALGWRVSAAVTSFRDSERNRRSDVAQMIAANHLAQIPTGALGEMAIIRGEMARQRGHMPIRKLIEKAGRSVQKIKPVFLMSPLSVAQFLPPGLIEFDLLVIDEASQVRPEDALGVIARSKQIVVVGDAKQLPPTNFFGRLMDDAAPVDIDDDEPDPDPEAGLRNAARVSDMESILTFCSARGLNAKMLRWHYRSRHPSLIAVSNAEFYDSHLYMPPSPSVERATEGFIRDRVQGSYERGGRRINTIEARAVVAALAEHARQASDRTIGVVTFSVSQRDEVLRLIDEERRNNLNLDMFLTNQTEEVFVKNLENVQGDERDVILISVGYGPRVAGGRLDAMSFGPVSVDGGARRLNVLFTRARFLCRAFVSFDSGDIDLQRATGEGARVLKRFLAFAETGQIDQPRVTGEDSDSPFEDDVASVIKSFGFPVDNQVGSAGFRIDLGVHDPDRPGRYILAVECDGATYHAAMWARERDRMRQELLEQLGWRFHRIWSTDWFHRREAEVQRLRNALMEAARAPTMIATPIPTPPIAPPPVVPQAVKSEPRALIYRLASVPVPSNQQPHEIAVTIMATIVAGIIDIEGPVHGDEVARRIASLFGKERTGTRIVAAVGAGLSAAKKSKAIIELETGFWCVTAQRQDCPVRDRSKLTTVSQKAEMLPIIEIEAAAMRVIQENGAVGQDELILGVARLMGFQHVGANLRVKFDDVIRGMVARGTFGKDGNNRLSVH